MRTYTHLPHPQIARFAAPFLAIALFGTALLGACVPDSAHEAAATFGPRGEPTTTGEDLSLLPVDASLEAGASDASNDSRRDTDAGGDGLSDDTTPGDLGVADELDGFFPFDAGLLDAASIMCPSTTATPVDDALVIEEGLRRLSEQELDLDYACIQRVGALDVCGNVRLTVSGEEPIVLGGGGVGVAAGGRAAIVLIAPNTSSVFLKGFCGAEEFSVSVFAPRADVTLTCAGSNQLAAFVRARSVSAYAQGPIDLEFSASVKDGEELVEAFSLIPSEPACPLRR